MKSEFKSYSAVGVWIIWIYFAPLPDAAAQDAAKDQQGQKAGSCCMPLEHLMISKTWKMGWWGMFCSDMFRYVQIFFYERWSQKRGKWDLHGMMGAVLYVQMFFEHKNQMDLACLMFCSDLLLWNSENQMDRLSVCLTGRHPSGNDCYIAIEHGRAEISWFFRSKKMI